MTVWILRNSLLPAPPSLRANSHSSRHWPSNPMGMDSNICSLIIRRHWCERPCSARLSDKCTAGTESGQITNEIWSPVSKQTAAVKWDQWRVWENSWWRARWNLYFHSCPPHFTTDRSSSGGWVGVVPGGSRGACEWFGHVPAALMARKCLRWRV